MYLSVRKSKSYSTIQNGEKVVLDYPDILKELQKDINVRDFNSKTETAFYKVGYWRKFNALHAYIVKNFAAGRDECQDILLTKRNINDLLSILKQVKEFPDKAEDLLPTSDGFFFGSLEYDDLYFDNVEYSIELFEKILKLFDQFEKEEDEDYHISYDIIYRASW